MDSKAQSTEAARGRALFSLAVALAAVAAPGASRAQPRNETGGKPPTAEVRSQPSPAGSPAKSIRRAHNFFEYGQHEKVVALLRPLIEKGLIKQKSDLVEAMRMYAVSLFLTGRKEAARLVFAKMVDLDPSLRLDPRLVPPEVVSAYDQIRNRALSAKIEKARETEPEVYGVLNLIPPAGQFQNGHHTKAWLILAAEVTLIALSATSYSILNSKKYRKDGSYVVQDVDGNVVEDHRTLAKVMLGINYASFGLLVGTVIYGIIDGYVVMHRQEEKREARRRYLKKQISVCPAVSGSSVGLSLSLSF